MDLTAGADAAVTALLQAEFLTPDLLIEQLVPFLWRRRPNPLTGNLAVDCSMVLCHAYAYLGIAAKVVAVYLIVRERSGEQHQMIGTPDPRWDDGRFDGHCVLVLPQSNRLVDATADQFAEVRRHRSHPVIGRVGLTGGPTDTAWDAVAPGTHLAIGDSSGPMLMYTVAGPDPVEVITSSPVVQAADARYRRAGVNLASHALTLLRIPEVRDRIRRARYPRLNDLLDTVGEAPFFVERDGDFSFAVRLDGSDRVLPLDQIAPAAIDPLPSREPVRRLPHATSDPDRVNEILNDAAAEARVVRGASPAMGGGDLPVVLFEPRGWVGIPTGDGTMSEAQAEGIILSGFARFALSLGAVPRLDDWSVVRTPSGLELWDRGGLWARADLTVEPEWHTAAVDHGAVLVIYGVSVGVRAPSQVGSYTETDREAELLESRMAGIAAVAEIPWAESAPASGARWWRMRRRADR